MNRRRNVYVGVSVITLVVVLTAVQLTLQTRAEAQGTQAGVYESAPFWPKPLPNHWVMGNTIGVSVDSKDHIWIIHRAGSLEAMETYAATNRAECCKPAPAVLVE